MDNLFKLTKTDVLRVIQVVSGIGIIACLLLKGCTTPCPAEENHVSDDYIYTSSCRDSWGVVPDSQGDWCSNCVKGEDGKKALERRGYTIGEIVKAVIEVESHSDHMAISWAGAIGEMQITPIALKEFNQFSTQRNYLMGEMFQSDKNIEVGTWYLLRLKNRYLKDKCTLETLLACYNGGYGRLRSVGYDWRKMPNESVEYVKKVMALL